MDLSFPELILVALIALLVFGPEDFIKKMSQMGRFIGRLKTQANNFRIMLQNEIDAEKNSSELSTQEKYSDSIHCDNADSEKPNAAQTPSTLVDDLEKK